jgi:hypothetical protein
MLPVLVGATAAILAAWRENNEPFDCWLQGTPMLVVAVSVVVSALNERRQAEQETLPRKRRLEALRRELDRLAACAVNAVRHRR